MEKYTIQDVYDMEDDFIEEYLLENGKKYTGDSDKDRYNVTLLMKDNNEIHSEDIKYIESPYFKDYYFIEDGKDLVEIAEVYDLYDETSGFFEYIKTFIDYKIDPNEKLEVREAELLPFQKTHFAKAMKILKNGIAYQDNSPMGSGKTYIISNIVKQLYKYNKKVVLFVVCPVAVKDKWLEVPQAFGIPESHIIVQGYEQLTGKKGSNNQNEYMNRYDAKGNHTYYRPSAKFIQMVRDGMLVVFDENQRIKNTKAKSFEVCVQIVEQLKNVYKIQNDRSKISRAVLVSASPGNEHIHTYAMLRLLGIADENMDSEYSFGKITNKDRLLRGLRSTLEYANKLNPSEASFYNKYKSENPKNNKEIYKICHDLYNYIIKDKMAIAMVTPPLEYTKDYMNGFYNISRKADRYNIRNALSDLGKIGMVVEEYRQNKEKLKKGLISAEEVQNKKESVMEVMTSAYMRIEKAKLYDIARVGRNSLRKPGKVIICVNYVKSIDILKQAFAKYSPLVLKGDVSMKCRKKILIKFQSPTNKHRVLICNTRVASVGIDLDDKYGNFPRTMFVIPDLRFLDNYQVTDRIARINTKSDPILRFFYSKTIYKNSTRSTNELATLSSFLRKSNIAKQMLSNGEDILFPGDYKGFVEKKSS